MTNPFLSARVWLFCGIFLGLLTHSAFSVPDQTVDAVDDLFLIQTQNPLVLSDILANDVVISGAAARRISQSQPSYGKLETTSGGGLIYTPNRYFPGTDSFNYTITNDEVHFDTATVTISNPFQPAAGVYTRFFVTDPVSPAHASYIQIKLDRYGRFTAHLKTGTREMRFKGIFSTTGETEPPIYFSGDQSISVQLAFDSNNGSPMISGMVTSAGATLNFVAPKNPFSRKVPANRAGSYTFRLDLEPPLVGTGIPSGIGFGKFTILGSGIARIAGRLPDGTSFLSSTIVQADQSLPFHIVLYRRPGIMFGVANFVLVQTLDSPAPAAVTLEGSLSWLKPRQKSEFYPRGFTLGLKLQGSKYTPPVTGRTAPLIVPNSHRNATFIAHGGGLGTLPSLDASILIAESNGVYEIPLSRRPGFRAVLILNAKTGLFTGRIIDRRFKHPFPFRGALIQSLNVGVGTFHGLTRPGSINLIPDELAPE